MYSLRDTRSVIVHHGFAPLGDIETTVEAGQSRSQAARTVIPSPKDLKCPNFRQCLAYKVYSSLQYTLARRFISSSRASAYVFWVQGLGGGGGCAFGVGGGGWLFAAMSCAKESREPATKEGFFGTRIAGC